MRFNQRHAGWAALICLNVAACASSSQGSTDTSARIRGRVIGPRGQMLDGVRITTQPPTDAVLTFEGEYEITREVKTKSPIQPGVYRMVPYKLGWWAGKKKPNFRIEYPGGDFVVPDIRLRPIGSPRMDNLAAPARRTFDRGSQGTGVIRDGE